MHWNDYLKKTRSEAVPESAFCMRKPYLFEAGMVLEAVDKKNPNLIRPAIITEVKDYEIKILYIGWPERYAYWIRDDSNEIFPPGYCRRTNHPIECPLGKIFFIINYCRVSYDYSFNIFISKLIFFHR